MKHKTEIAMSNVYERKIPAGFQLELFWVLYDVPMVAGQFINMRNNTVARTKKTHFGKVAHMNYVYCIANIFILFDMALISVSCYILTV